MKPKDIIDAWAEIRKTNNSIPDDVLDYMKDSAISRLNQYDKKEVTVTVSGIIASGKSHVMYAIKNMLTDKNIEVKFVEESESSKNYTEYLNKSDLSEIKNRLKVNLIEQTTNFKPNTNK